MLTSAMHPLLALLPSALASPLLSHQSYCPLPPKISVANDLILPSLHFLHNASVRNTQADRLSRAVQIPTTVTDYMTDPEDAGFAPFVDFQQLLRDLFPLVHKHAQLSHINHHSLLYTLPGTTPSNNAKPLLFLAHQDVVPIDDASDWHYPPFSGHYDGTYVWGRGASDCKNSLIGVLSAVEDLLSQGLQPARTVVLAFGFDEEAHGFLGAGHLAPELERRFGKDGIELILDEGGNGIQTISGKGIPETSQHGGDDDGDVVYALPAVGEKGSLDLVLDLAVPGGHSSIPPAHTGIGIMADIITALEREHLDLFAPLLDENHPTRRTLECQVVHSPNHVEPWLASALSAGNSRDSQNLARKLGESRGDKFRVTLQTTQAVDVIHGGVKSNALPEKISAVVNYRVALHQSPDTVIDRAVRLIAPIVEGYNLSFTHPSSPREDDGKINHLSLTTLVPPLEPAPISPTNVPSDHVWTRFAGVARSVFESVPSLAGKKVVVSGDVMTGNTDTRFYWNLSRNIYRWNPLRDDPQKNIHTVDERQSVDTHLESIMFYYDLIRAFDNWNDMEKFAHEL